MDNFSKNLEFDATVSNMKVKEEKICRLCLKEAENDFQIVDEATRRVFEVLLLKVNLDIIKDPIVCKDCREISMKCFNFKATFRLQDLYKEEKDVETIDDYFVCRFCRNHLIGDNFLLLNTLTNDLKFVETFQALMPETSFDDIKNSVICTTCEENLKSYIKFTENCYDVEDKILQYCRNKDVPSTSVSLTEMLPFLYENVREAEPRRLAVKQEEDALELYDYKLVKLEPIDVKEETVNIETASETPSEPRKDVTNLEIHKCSKCTYKTKRKRDLNRHTLIHKDVAEVEMYKCPTCAFQSRQKGNLKKHSLVHKDVRDVNMYKCTTCTYATKRRGDLRSHVTSVHKHITEVKVYKCPICNYRSKRNWDIKPHMLIHKSVAEVEIYKCSMCAFQTRHKQSLKNHTLIHKDVTEVAMCECPLCAYKTKRKRNLDRHMLIHKDVEEVEIYRCTVCSFKTKHKYNLKVHNKKMHECETLN